MSGPGAIPSPSAGGRRNVNPVAMILGETAAAGGPFALLGLAPGAVTQAEVARALELRLQHVNRHPLGGIPEADDVRLALHAAAAQVLNPEVRASLLDLNRSSPPAAAPTVTDPAHDPMMQAIAMHGGINDRSIRQMMLLTAAGHQGRGALAAQIQERLAGAHRTPSAPAHSPAPRTPTSRPVPTATLDPFSPAAREAMSRDDQDPGVRALKMIVISALAVIAAAAVVLVGVLLLLNKPKPGAPWIPEPAPTSQTQGGKELFPASKDVPPPPSKNDGTQAAPPQEIDDPVAIARVLASAATDVVAKPEESLTRFVEAIKGLSIRWQRLASDQLGASQDSIVEFLYRSPTPEIAEAALNAVANDRYDASAWTQERVRAQVWRAGMLARLARERDLPAGVRTLVDRASAGSSGPSEEPGTFARGAMAMLSTLPGEMISGTAGAARTAPPSPAQVKEIVAAWTAWREACRLVVGSDDAGFDRLLLTGLETILVDGPEPAADYGLGDVIKDIVLGLSWRKDAPARSWLIASFSSTQLTSADLELVTRTLASSSSASGVDGKMVLASNSDEKARIELRDAYATAWGMGDPARRDEMLVQWREQVAAAEQPTSITRQDEHHVAALGRALTKARLNLAATMIWAGLVEEPAAIIKDPAAAAAGLVTQAQNAATPGRIDDGGTDGSWAVKYLAAEQRVPERLKLLSELLHSNRALGQVDAAVVVSEAVRGTPESVRSAARDAMDPWASTPAVLYALLQESYRIPKTRINAEIVASITLARLPGLRDPNWYAGVRRALVDKLLQALAARGPEKAIDQLAEELAATCEGRAKPSGTALTSAPPTGSARKASAPPTAEQSITDLMGQWKRTAEPMLPTGREPFTLDQVSRRLSARLALAVGPVQEFAARHLCVAEMMAYVVSIEQPSHSTEVKTVMDELARQRREAIHVLDQIDAAELAMMRLWRIRLEGGVL